jgi:signal transduction histidine kinase
MPDHISVEGVEPESAFSRMILETITGLFFVIDSDQKVLHCNAAFENIFDASERQSDFIKSHIRRTLDEGNATDEIRIVRDGQRLFFRLTSRRSQANGRPCVVGFGIDISETKAIEALQSGQNRVLVALATGQSLEQVLTTLILAAEEQCDGMLGSIMLLDEQGLHLSPCAAPSLPRDYVAAIAGLRIGPDVGSCGAAAYLKKPVFIESIEHSPNWIKALELTRHHDLHACWSHPIFSTDNRVLGTFAMYYRKERRPDATLMRIIESGAHLAGLAIERSRVESQLKAAKDAADAANRDLEQRVRQRTSELNEMHKQLLDASRQAGMAEVATGVLHNVGNVLNSVNVSANILKDHVAKSSVKNIAKASSLIRSHRDDLAAYLSSDAKGKLLPDYLAEMGKELATENATVLEELDALARGIDHIMEVVQTQQDFAKNSTFRQKTDPAALVEDAVNINLLSLERHNIEIVRELQDLGEVEIDKHKTLQVLINLISNAKDALTHETHHGPRKITVRLSACGQGAERKLRFEVQDTGIGIAPENFARIFRHGFTTRTGGHGFGLHSSANAALEMNGSLKAYSDGDGKGARFVLEIPLQPSEATVS